MNKVSTCRNALLDSSLSMTKYLREGVYLPRIAIDHREIDFLDLSESCQIKQELECNYTLPIHPEPKGIQFDSKSIGK